MPSALANEIGAAAAALLEGRNKNVVLYSSIFPFAKLIEGDPRRFCADVLDVLRARTATLLLPAFTDGFKDGVCDLDSLPSATGALTETFRTSPGVGRTFCPFFSFGVAGDKAGELLALRPREAWGKGSLYEWIYNNDATIMTLGTDVTHCSFTHYAEYLCKDIITYRYDKDFEGDVICRGAREHCKTRLFVRNLNPSPVNDWTWAAGLFVKESGMRIAEARQVKLSAVSAKRKIDALLPLIRQDKYRLISNRELFEK